MRVVGTRRTAQPDAPLPAGFSALGNADELDRFLAQSDFVAVCCQWTPATTNLIDATALGRMKPEARTAFALFAIDGRSIAEVAELTETTQIAAKVRIWRARRELERRAASDPVLAEFLEAT